MDLVGRRSELGGWREATKVTRSRWNPISKSSWWERGDPKPSHHTTQAKAGIWSPPMHIAPYPPSSKSPFHSLVYDDWSPRRHTLSSSSLWGGCGIKGERGGLHAWWWRRYGGCHVHFSAVRGAGDQGTVELQFTDRNVRFVDRLVECLGKIYYWTIRCVLCPCI